MMIIDWELITEQIRERANGAPEPVQACWLIMPDGEKSDAYYCRDCVHGEASFEGARAVIPQNGHFTIEEFAAHCENCGAILAYTLNELGIREEIDHYARVDITTPREWREIEQVSVVIVSCPDELQKVFLAIVQKNGITVEE